MLNNITHRNPEIEKKIIKLVGKEYSIIEKIKLNGVGSQNLLIKKSDNTIYDILKNDYTLNRCNIEIRPKGIILFINSKLETYSLSIPYYKLIIFKIDEKNYTISYDHFFLKLKVKNQSDHKFFKKLSKQKALFIKNKFI